MQVWAFQSTVSGNLLCKMSFTLGFCLIDKVDLETTKKLTFMLRGVHFSPELSVNVDSKFDHSRSIKLNTAIRVLKVSNIKDVLTFIQNPSFSHFIRFLIYNAARVQNTHSPKAEYQLKRPGENGLKEFLVRWLLLRNNSWLKLNSTDYIFFKNYHDGSAGFCNNQTVKM